MGRVRRCSRDGGDGVQQPVAALANTARYVWLHAAADWLDVLNAWLLTHVTDFAVVLPLLITLAVCGAYRGSVTIAEPRASTTFWYLTALATYAPEGVAQGWMLLLAGLVIGFIVAHARGLGGWRWLSGTVVNIAFAAVWVPASLLLWLFVLNTPDPRSSARTS